MRGIISAAGLRPVPAPPARRHRQDVRHRRRQGHPLGRLVRRGHHHDGGRGRPARAADRTGLPSTDAVWFATADPAYLDKTNATAIHAALRLDRECPALDLGGALRSGRRRAADRARRRRHDRSSSTSDIRTGLPTGADESAGGDGAAASSSATTPTVPVIAEYLGAGAATDEFVDRWRTPGDRRSKVWEERFGETKYVPLGEQAWQARAQGGGARARRRRPGRGHRHARPRGDVAREEARAATTARSSTTSAGTVGNTGHRAGRRCCSRRCSRRPSRARCSRSWCSPTAPTCCCSAPPTRSPTYRPARPVAAQVGIGAPTSPTASSSRGAAWSPSSRPAGPSRLGSRRPRRAASRGLEVRLRRVAGPHAPARCTSRRRASRWTAARSTTWSRRRWPTSRAPSSRSRSTSSRTRRARRSCSRSSTSTAAAASRWSSPTSTRRDVKIGDRVEMTFRRLFTADGIHNYFWKARPVRAAAPAEENRWVRTGSRTGSRSSAWAARRSASAGTTASTTCSIDAAEPGLHRARASTRTSSTRTGSAPRRAA